ncbi:MAG: TIR domain-containing protein [Planctomycetota bacterium]|jgi:hypothetical protein
MSLPTMVTIEDVSDLVAYLKTKPTGTTSADVRKVIRKQVLDHRKKPIYQAWDIVRKEGENLKLGDRGWRLARNSRPRHLVYQEIVKSYHSYLAALKWVFYQGLEGITSVDVGTYWQEHHSAEAGNSEKTLKEQAVSFFRLCEASNLGNLTIGRRGQPTRLSINKDGLELFINRTLASEAKASQFDECRCEVVEDGSPATRSGISGDNSREQDEYEAGVLPAEETRVFLSHSEHAEIVNQMEAMLGLAGINCEIAARGETSAVPVPERVLNSMRKCNAAIIVVSAEGDDDSSHEHDVSQNVLTQIGTAFVLYRKKVILLWDKRIPVPPDLQSLPRSEFEGSELTLKSAMKVVRAIQDFCGLRS